MTTSYFIKSHIHGSTCKKKWKSYWQLISVLLLYLVTHLLYCSGDIETNPGPESEGFSFLTLHSFFLLHHYSVCIVELTIKNLSHIRNLIIDANTKWFDLGLELEVPYDDLKVIECDYQKVNDRFREMLSTWLKRVDPPPTMERLAVALDEKSVELHDLAKKIRALCGES